VRRYARKWHADAHPNGVVQSIARLAQTRVDADRRTDQGDSFAAGAFPFSDPAMLSRIPTIDRYFPWTLGSEAPLRQPRQKYDCGA